MSVHAKSAEDAWAAAQKQAHDKVVSLKVQAHDAAKTAVEKVDQDIKSVAEFVARDLNTLKAKIASDKTLLKSYVAEAKHELDVKRAENRAERLDWEAEFAIDYAIAAIEQAKLAVLDAVDGRLAAERVKRAYRDEKGAKGGLAAQQRCTRCELAMSDDRRGCPVLDHRPCAASLWP